MSYPLADRIAIPPQALLGHDHILGPVQEGTDDVGEEMGWRISHPTIKYVPAGGEAPGRIVVVDYEAADGSTGRHEFTDMRQFLWVALPRSEAAVTTSPTQAA
jgi:hypothetical protein